MSALGISLLFGLFDKHVINNTAPAINSPIRLSYNAGILHILLICCKPPFRNVSRKSSLKAISMPLLSDTITISYASGTILSIVTETMLINTSMALVISIFVASVDFV